MNLKPRVWMIPLKHVTAPLASQRIYRFRRNLGERQGRTSNMRVRKFGISIALVAMGSFTVTTAFSAASEIKTPRFAQGSRPSNPNAQPPNNSKDPAGPPANDPAGPPASPNNPPSNPPTGPGPNNPDRPNNPNDPNSPTDPGGNSGGNGGSNGGNTRGGTPGTGAGSDGGAK